MHVKVKKLTETAKLPTRGSVFSAGFDLYADNNVDITIHPHETRKIGTGLALEIPDGYYGAIFARSGLATKEGLRPANCVGICDSDYRGEYIVAIHNDSNEDRIIEPKERIAQLIIMQYPHITFEEVDKLSETVRDTNGFGSTGK